MEKFKDMFKFNPLMVNRFVITLPKSLGIDEFYVKKFKVSGNSITVDIIETLEKNIRDNYTNIEEINKNIGEDNILIEYLDPYGKVARREIYENVHYEGESYESEGNYDDLGHAITTGLVFSFKNRKNATAN